MATETFKASRWTGGNHLFTTVIEVTDTGTGIAKDVLPLIWDSFYTTKPEGMGIGLAICRSIVEFHSGRLWVESRREGGSAFHFTVPIEETPGDDDD